MEKELTQALKLISEWKPLPDSLARKLPPALLKRLLQIVEQLRAQGLGGPKRRTPERLLAMQKLINRLSQPEREMEPDYPGIGEAESLAVRQANAQTAMDQRRILGELRR